MAIERIYANEDLDNILFHVSEEVEVYDGQIAIILNHLFNHLKMLSAAGISFGTKDLGEYIAPHASHYGLSSEWQFKSGELKKLAEMISAECALLVNYYRQLLSLESETRPENSALILAKMDEIVSEAQSRIPFLDYHYRNGRSEQD
jgi:hypothetical protein